MPSAAEDAAIALVVLFAVMSVLVPSALAQTNESDPTVNDSDFDTTEPTPDDATATIKVHAGHVQMAVENARQAAVALRDLGVKAESDRACISHPANDEEFWLFTAIAKRLAATLKDAGIVAIYSTDTVRTRLERV